MDAIFETERLLVRQYTPEDAEAAFRIYGDPEVAHWGPDESVEATRAGLKRIQARYGHDGGLGCWAIEEKETGSVVGSVILKRLPGWPEIEGGWHLARR